MTVFDRLESGVDFHIGEYIDRLGRVWWEYRCGYAECTVQVQSASAVDADMHIREHIVAVHTPDRKRTLIHLADMAEHLGEPS